ncbi:hypothetical protein LTR27_009502 [Elasticomyces elasticus]|nr:hypothetical protein LTR27_009502 [Elasticomyces elasticus]
METEIKAEVKKESRANANVEGDGESGVAAEIEDTSDVEVVEDQDASTRTTDRSGSAGATDSAGRVNSTAEIIDLCEDD